MARPPAGPSLPDPGEVFRKAIEEGIKQGFALAEKEKGKH